MRHNKARANDLVISAALLRKAARFIDHGRLFEASEAINGVDEVLRKQINHDMVNGALSHRHHPNGEIKC